MSQVKDSCDFCGRPSNDILYGPMHQLEDVKCHYYCLLFSTNLVQNGRDQEGILGFLLPDIKKELNRAKRVNCSYCHKPGGVSVCYSSKCNRKFHLPCGIERGSLHLFFNNFRSYCGEHRTVQKVPANILSSKDVTCIICFDPIEDLTSNDSIWAPCCKKNGWFHRLCIQRFALNAAYFFKCPLCANHEKFRDAMLRNGIYIPDQDASWELEPNAFAELLERHHHCDAAVCKCPRGRKFGSETSRLWNLILCQSCASKGIHIGCIPGPRSSVERHTKWDCSDCEAIIQGQSNLQGDVGNIRYQSEEENDDEEDDDEEDDDKEDDEEDDDEEDDDEEDDDEEDDDKEDDDEEDIIVVDDESEEEDFCDKIKDVANFDVTNLNIRKSLSNVIHLESTAVDFIDLENDETESMETEAPKDDDDDDEPQYMLDTNIRKIPLNVIHLKSTALDLIDLENDESEPMEIEAPKDDDGDDEPQCIIDAIQQSCFLNQKLWRMYGLGR